MVYVKLIAPADRQPDDNVAHATPRRSHHIVMSAKPNARATGERMRALSKVKRVRAARQHHIAISPI